MSVGFRQKMQTIKISFLLFINIFLYKFALSFAFFKIDRFVRLQVPFKEIKPKASGQDKNYPAFLIVMPLPHLEQPGLVHITSRDSPGNFPITCPHSDQSDQICSMQRLNNTQPLCMHSWLGQEQSVGWGKKNQIPTQLTLFLRVYFLL